jgi:hypothetical protein
LKKIFVVPGVFADGESNPCAPEVNGGERVAGLEIASFIEDVVGWQQALVALADQAPIVS